MQFRCRDVSVDQAEGLSFRGRNPPARRGQVPGRLGRQAALEVLQASTAERSQSDARLRESEPGMVGRIGHVAGQNDFGPAAQGEAVDRNDLGTRMIPSGYC